MKEQVEKSVINHTYTVDSKYTITILETSEPVDDIRVFGAWIVAKEQAIVYLRKTLKEQTVDLRTSISTMLGLKSPKYYARLREKQSDSNTDRKVSVDAENPQPVKIDLIF